MLVSVCLCVFRFDEVYYGQFVSLYMKRVFFVDESGPPLGHMILAFGGEFFDATLDKKRCCYIHN